MSKKKRKERGKAKEQKSAQKKSAVPPKAQVPLVSKEPQPLLPAWLDQWLGKICFAGLIILSFLMSFHNLVDTDIFWQLKAGEIIFETRRVPHQDLFSFTVAGKEWIDAQWLFQLVIYLFYKIGGYTGLTLFGALLMALTWGLLLFPAYESKKYFRVIILGCISLLASSSRLRLRPEFFTFFFLSLELFLLNLYQVGKRRALYLIPILLCLWVNSHGLWPVGLFILGAYLAERVISFPQLGFQKYFKLRFASGAKKELKELGICLIASSLAVWLNPYGWKGIVFPLKLLWEISSSESFIGSFIGEFQTPFLLNNPVVRPAYFVLTALGGLFFIFLVLSRRLYLADLLILGGFFYISAVANRNVPLFAMVMAMVGSKLMLELSAPSGLWAKRFILELSRFRSFAGGILIILMLWLSGEIIRGRFFIWDRLYCDFGVGVLEKDFPIRAVEFLKSIPELELKSSLNIFTDLRNSGYLLWSGYPKWKVYVDPRMEVYGDEFIKRYASLFEHWQEFVQEDQKYQFDLVLVSAYRINSNFVRNLYKNPAWVLVYLDGNNAVFVKNQPHFYSIIDKYRLNLNEQLSTPLPKTQNKFWMAKERNNRGLVLLWLGYKESALYEFTEGIKYLPEDPFLNYNLGLTLNELHRYSEALPYLEKYAKIDPGDIPNQRELAWALASTGKSDRAVMILQGILNVSPNDITSCMKLAEVYELLKDNPQASQQWRRCQAIYQRSPDKFAREVAKILQALKRLEGN